VLLRLVLHGIFCIASSRQYFTLPRLIHVDYMEWDMDHMEWDMDHMEWDMDYMEWDMDCME